MGVEPVLRWTLSPPLLVAAIVLLAAVGAWQFLALRGRLSTARALLVATLRVAAVLLVIVVIAGPQVVRRTILRVRRPIAVLVDTSRSMGLRGGLDQDRLARVQAFLQSPEYKRFAAGYLPEYFSFSDGVTKVAEPGLPGLQATGARTDLAAALAAVADQMPGSLAATIVLTDGGHQSPGAAPPGNAPGGPLVVVGVGAGERLRDLEIREARGPAIAFAGQPVAIRVAVRAAGFAGTRLPLLLKRGEQVLASKTFDVPVDGAVSEVSLEWVPPSPGRYALSVQVPVQDGEQIADNNRREVTLEAVRDKIRVLLLSGTPTWSYRFLRSALKGDPTIDLVSFIILRTATDAVDVPQQELSLIPFPTQKIFLEELPNFDLLIFDDFSFQPYLPAGYLDRVHDYVRGGGGFWMLGGPLSFSGGRYETTAIARVLPVLLAEPKAGTPPYREEAYRPVLTTAGAGHPFFQGAAGQGDGLPPLTGLNTAGRPREGATVLAEAPLPDGGRQPLVVIGRYGEGRVMAVLTNSLWKWAFEEVGRGRGNRAYQTLVRQAVRWSVGDPQLQPLRVEAEAARVAPGGRLRAKISALGEDFLPARNAELSVVLRDPAGVSRALTATQEAPGVYQVEAETAGVGTWEITAEASVRGTPYGRAATSVTAAWPEEEYRDPGLNRAAAASLLEGRPGAVLDLGDPRETVPTLERILDELPGGAPDTREEASSLGEQPWVFAAFLCIIGAEWIIRRRSGLD